MLRSPKLHLVFAWLLAGGTVVLMIRLAIPVAVTPSSDWTTEFLPFTTMTEQTAIGGIAARSANILSDPAIARALIGDCVANPGLPSVWTACLKAIEYGLQAKPLSAELWLARGQLLVRLGALDERLVESLANSYSAGPMESWVAATRLPFALRMHTYLPPEMLDAIGRDIELVIRSRQLALPLINAYIADPFLRDETWGLIQQYSSLDQQEQLIDWIRREI